MQGDYWIGDRLIRSRLNLIEYQDTTLRLEPKVMQVLLVLIEHGGDVVTRQQIRETVWPDIFVGDDVLVRAISELRRAFNDAPHTHHTIETITKVGYRLVAPVVDVTEESSQESSRQELGVEPGPNAETKPAGAETVALPDEAGSKDRLKKLFLGLGMVFLLVSVTAIFIILYPHLKSGARTDSAVSSTPVQNPPARNTAQSTCGLISGAVYEVKNNQTGAVLEVPYASAINGTLVDEWKSNGGDNQHWILRSDGPYWTFTNVASGKRLDLPEANRTVGIQLDQWQANQGTNQNWILLPAGDNGCKIISQASGLLIDVDRGSVADGTPIIQFPDNDGLNQHWIFHLIHKPVSDSSSR